MLTRPLVVVMVKTLATTPIMIARHTQVLDDQQHSRLQKSKSERPRTHGTNAILKGWICRHRRVAGQETSSTNNLISELPVAARAAHSPNQPTKHAG